MPQARHCVCSIKEMCVSALNLEHTGFACAVSHIQIPWIPTLVYNRKKGSPENNAAFPEKDTFF